LAVRSKEPRRMQPPGLGERGLPLTYLSRQRCEQGGPGAQLAGNHGRLDSDRLERAFAADSARRGGVEMALEPRRVERVRLDLDRVRRQVGRWLSAPRLDAF